MAGWAAGLRDAAAEGASVVVDGGEAHGGYVCGVEIGMQVRGDVEDEAEVGDVG